MMAIGESDHRMRGAAKGITTKAQNCGKIRKKCEIWFQLSRTQTTAGADNRLNGRHMDDPSQRILPKLFGAIHQQEKEIKIKR